MSRILFDVIRDNLKFENGLNLYNFRHNIADTRYNIKKTIYFLFPPPIKSSLNQFSSRIHKNIDFFLIPSGSTRVYYQNQIIYVHFFFRHNVFMYHCELHLSSHALRIYGPLLIDVRDTVQPDDFA